MTNVQNNETACKNNIQTVDQTVGMWLSNAVGEHLEHSNDLHRAISTQLLKLMDKDNKLTDFIQKSVWDRIDEDSLCDGVVERLQDNITENVAAHVDIDDLAGHFDTGELASEMTDDVAEALSNDISISDVADHLDIDDIANAMDADDIAQSLWGQVESKVDGMLCNNMFMEVVADQMMCDTNIVAAMCDKLEAKMEQRRRDNQWHRRSFARCKQLASKVAAKFRRSEAK